MKATTEAVEQMIIDIMQGAPILAMGGSFSEWEMNRRGVEFS